jgi:hypothetical protein
MLHGTLALVALEQSIACRSSSTSVRALVGPSESMAVHWSTPSQGAALRLHVEQGRSIEPNSMPAAPATSVGSQSVTCISPSVPA